MRARWRALIAAAAIAVMLPLAGATKCASPVPTTSDAKCAANVTSWDCGHPRCHHHKRWDNWTGDCRRPKPAPPKRHHRNAI